jgi:predicted DNA-binding protein (MmcQ/YjbR family)
MNKKHWISVDIDYNSNLLRIQSWIDRSYELVVNSLPRKVQEEI